MYFFAKLDNAGIINVKDFEAKGDGVTDDTSAIQAAINWTAASAVRGNIYFPRGRYLVSSPIQLPFGPSASYGLVGELGGSFVFGNFNGFVFDGLSNPYTSNTGGIVIEGLNISNGYAGQNSNKAASSSWSASGSPVTINVPDLPSGITNNCLVYIIDQKIAPMPVFVGITSSVVPGTSITLPTTAVSSGGFSNLNLAFVQSYAANGTWANNATTIPMSGSPPAVVPSNCLVYDYDRILYGDGTIPGVYTSALGVGNWSGSTVTFTAGVAQGSHTSTDRLVFAPLAGCIRLSSAIAATVRDCVLSGFIGITTSQDNVNTSGQQTGAESYSILIENNSLSTSAHAAAIGSTGIYMTNNSLSLVNDLSSWWVGTRISGIANEIKSGRTEVCTYGIALQADQNTGIVSAGGVDITGLSMESHVYAIVQVGGSNVTLNAVSIICQNSNGQFGVYLSGGLITVQSCSIQGNWAQYAIYIPDQGNQAGQITFISTKASNNFGGGVGVWRLPAQAWWGTCIQCNNPALVYTFANLPSGVSSPAPVEGDEYNISDSPTATWGANVTTGGSSNHVKVRYNGSNWTVVGK